MEKVMESHGILKVYEPWVIKHTSENRLLPHSHQPVKHV